MMPFAATWMDIEVIILSKVTQKDNNKYYIISLIYKSKCDTNELIYETEKDLHRKQTYGYQKV